MLYIYGQVIYMDYEKDRSLWDATSDWLPVWVYISYTHSLDSIWKEDLDPY